MPATAGAGFWGRTLIRQSKNSVNEMCDTPSADAAVRLRARQQVTTVGLPGVGVRCEYLTQKQLLARTADSHERAGAAEFGRLAGADASRSPGEGPPNRTGRRLP